VVMFALLVWDRFPSWLVFMGALTAAMTLRLAPPDALLNGFGNTGVITVAMVVLAAFGVTSMLNAALLATMAMLLTGCVTSKRVWNSLEWQTIVVLVLAPIVYGF
jgi:di/tricarboxylate transporter